MFWRAGVLAGVAVLATAVVEDPSARISSEFARLRNEAPQVLSPSDAPAVMARIDRGEAAMKAGRLYLALYEVQPAFESIGGYALAKTEKAYPAQADFARKWKAMGMPPSPPSARVAPCSSKRSRRRPKGARRRRIAPACRMPRTRR